MVRGVKSLSFVDHPNKYDEPAPEEAGSLYVSLECDYEVKICLLREHRTDSIFHGVG